MKEKSHADWFKQLAATVRTIVDDLGGAVVMTRERLNQAAVEVDPDLEGCPPYVLKHLTCALWPREGLRSRTYGKASQVLIIFDPRVVPDVEAALLLCEDHYGIPEDVEICLMEAGFVRAVPA